MRCVNCGYDNAAGCAVCIKCGHSLQAFEQSYYDPIEKEMSRGTVVGQFSRKDVLRPTMIGVAQNSLGNPIDTAVFKEEGRKTQLVSPKPCHSCGYPIVANHVTCPNCGVSLTKEEKRDEKAKEEIVLNGSFECPFCQKEIPLTSVFCPSCGQKVHAPTVSPEQLAKMISNIPHCFLTMLSDGNEPLDQSKKEYRGETVILNRMNTEENNCTITTQKQAKLVFENGEWYMQNLSERQTTYLILKRKVQLEDGDIIVMGNRRFKFEKK